MKKLGKSGHGLDSAGLGHPEQPLLYMVTFMKCHSNPGMEIYVSKDHGFMLVRIYLDR